MPDIDKGILLMTPTFFDDNDPNNPKKKTYIERKEAIEFVRNNTPHFDGETTMQCVERSLANVPAADVVEVIRCKKCRHYNTSCCGNGLGWCEYYNTGATDEHFCSHGEKGV